MVSTPIGGGGGNPFAAAAAAAAASGSRFVMPQFIGIESDGSGDTITLSPVPPITEYSEDDLFLFVSPFTSVSTVTVSVSGLVEVPLVDSAGVAVAADGIENGDLVTILYDNDEDNFVLADTGNEPDDSGGIGPKAGLVSGSNNAISLTVDPAITAYAAGQQFIFTAQHTSNGNVTMNVSTLGAVQLRLSANVQAGAGQIVNGHTYVIVHTGSYFLIVNEEPAEIPDYSIDDDKLQTPNSTAARLVGSHSFEIVAAGSDPDEFDQFEYVQGSDFTEVVLTLAPGDLSGTPDLIDFYTANTHNLLGQFRVTGLSAAGFVENGDAGVRYTLTGFLTIDNSGINTFTLGAVGTNVEIDFCEAVVSTAHIPHRSENGVSNAVVGYDENGRLMYRDDGYLALDLPRVSGRNFTFTYANPITIQGSLSLVLDEEDEYTIQVSQALTDPQVDFLDWLGVHDVIELVEGSDYSRFYVTAVSSTDHFSFTSVTVTARRIHHSNLALADGDTVELRTNRYYDSPPDRWPGFVLGHSYPIRAIVRYQNVLYQARAAISNAQTIPPSDPTNWDEITTHGFEGFGSFTNEQEATLHLTSTSPVHFNTGDEFNRDTSIESQSGLPPVFVSLTDAGRMVANVDQTEFKFSSDDDFDIQFSAIVDGANPSVRFTLYARIRPLGVSDFSQPAHRLKEFDGALPAANSDGNYEVTATNSEDVVLTLEATDEIDLFWTIEANSANYLSGLIRDPNTGDQLRVLVSGSSDQRHTFGFGTGDNEDSIVVVAAGETDETEIFDLDEDGEHVGPTKLAGLVDDLTQDERIALVGKLMPKTTLYNPNSPTRLATAGGVGNFADDSSTPTTVNLSTALDLDRDLRVLLDEGTRHYMVIFPLGILEDGDFDSDNVVHLVSSTQSGNPSSSSANFNLYLRIDTDDLTTVLMGAPDEGDIDLVRIEQRF